MIPATITLADRDRLLAGQHLVLATGRHRTECGAQVGPPFAAPADRRCPHPATHRIERLDYTTGTTTPAGFTPAVVASRVCAEHAIVVQDEPGLIDFTEIQTSGPVPDGAR
jgi:hypothetical protein